MDAVLAKMAAERAPRRPVTEADITEAIRAPMAVPSAAKSARAARPARRETPQQALKADGAEAQATMMYAVPGMPPMSSWTPLQRELWRQAHEDHDPRVRSDAWAALEKELAGPRQEAVKTVRVLTWGPGPEAGRTGSP